MSLREKTKPEDLLVGLTTQPVKVRVCDDQDRDIMLIKNGEILVARFPEMTEEYKKFIADMFCDFTGSSRAEILRFLNFVEEDEFCS